MKNLLFILQYYCNFSRRQIEQHGFEKLLISIIKFLFILWFALSYFSVRINV